MDTKGIILKKKKDETEQTYEDVLKKVVASYLQEKRTYTPNKYKYSYDDIAIIVGISKYKVNKIAKELNLTRRKNNEE